MPWFFRIRLLSIEFGKADAESDDEDGGLEGTVGGAYADEQEDVDGAMGARPVRRLRQPRDRVDADRKPPIGFVP